MIADVIVTAGNGAVTNGAGGGVLVGFGWCVLLGAVPWRSPSLSQSSGRTVRTVCRVRVTTYLTSGWIDDEMLCERACARVDGMDWVGFIVGVGVNVISRAHP